MAGYIIDVDITTPGLRLRSATEIEETLIDQINPVTERSRSHMVLAAPAYCFK